MIIFPFEHMLQLLLSSYKDVQLLYPCSDNIWKVSNRTTWSHCAPDVGLLKVMMTLKLLMWMTNDSYPKPARMLSGLSM